MKPLGKGRAYALIMAFSLVEALTHFGNANPIRGDPALDFDSPFYVHMLYYLKGSVSHPPSPPFKMRPLVPSIALPLSSFMGVNNAFGAVNTAFWVLTAITLYRLVEDFFKSREVALPASILFSSSVPALVYGAAISTDMAGLFFVTLGVLLALRAKTLKGYIAEGALIGIGVLARETVSILVPIILLLRLYGKTLDIKRLALELLTICSIASVPVMTYWQVIPEPNYTAYFASSIASAFTLTKPVKALEQIILTYHVGYLYVIGYLTKEGLRLDKTIQAILLPTVGFLIFDYFVGVPTSRFVFMTAPAILPLMAVGMHELSGRTVKGPKPRRALTVVLLITYVALSNVGTLDKNLCFPSLNDEPITKLLPPEIKQKGLN